MADEATYPCAGGDQPHLIIDATYKDPATGATYVHRDLVQTQEAWAEEQHKRDYIPPMATERHLGDVESFVAYVQRYGGKGSLLTWNAAGLYATLDYAEGPDKPGRGTWKASHQFARSLQWLAWTKLLNMGICQKDLVERIEDLAEDIIEPDASTLTNILRNLRANVTNQAQAELRPDGSASISFSKESAVKTAASVELPALFRISIPILRGHADEQGKPVHYVLDVRLRLTIDESARLSFRLSMPTAERAMEMVYADRVSKAQELLGDSFQLLRAAD